MSQSQEFFRKDRILTGVHGLDVVLEGGYQNASTNMLLAPAGQEKFAFAFHFAWAGIKQGDKVVYIVLDLNPEEIETRASTFGMNFKEHTGNKLIFIDAYSQSIGAREGSRKDILIAGPGALNDLSLALNDVINKAEAKPMRIILHSLSTLTLYSQAESVLKFLQVIDGRLKNANATSLWLVDEGIHDKKFITSLETMCNSVFSISDKDGMRMLYISDIPIPIQIRIGAAGIEIL